MDARQADTMKAATGDDVDQAADLMADYVAYCADSSVHPLIWPANATNIYNWWLNRSAAQVAASYGTTNGTHSLATITISGAQDANTAVEVLAQGFGSVAVSLLRTNGVVTTNNYRIVGEILKVLVGSTVTNVQVEYFPGPVARNDFYTATEGQALNVSAAAGVLSNDWSGSWPGLIAITNGGPSHGILEWDINGDGGFTYTPATNFWSTDCFTYEAKDEVNNFGTATVTISVTATNGLTTDLFSDDFVRCLGTALDPWQVGPSPSDGQWSLGGGAMQGSQVGDYGYCYLSPTWTGASYSVEAQVQLTSVTYGGGLGACLTASTGAHYAAWLYPGANVLKLVKFYTWTTWGNDGTDNHQAMAETNLPSIGTDWHPLKLVCSNGALQVYYHGTNVISISDPISPVYSTGGVSLDIYDGGISVSNLIVAPIP